MKAFKCFFLCFLFLFHQAFFAKPIETFYGTIEVTEPVLLELIESKPMQRLKDVRQYGISYYLTHSEEYTRYDHSLGVFAILRMKGMSLHEQIAGLLHDVSHTVFSHVGDYVFEQTSHQDSYQDNIHDWFLEKYGIGKILRKHGFTIEQVLAKSKHFIALEQELPNLCADRIDYNLQGAYHQKFLTKKEVQEVFEDLEFKEKKWISSKPHLMKKLARFSLFMTQDCWGSPENYFGSSWLAEALKRALEVKVITKEDIFFGTDQIVWEKLHQSKDPLLKNCLQKVTQVKERFSLVPDENADFHIKMKFRGVDPWIKKGGKLLRLTDLDEEIAKEFKEVKARMSKGWPCILK